MSGPPPNEHAAFRVPDSNHTLKEPASPGRVLVLNPSRSLVAIAQDILQKDGHKVELFSERTPLTDEVVKAYNADVLIVDPFIDGYEGLPLLDRLPATREPGGPKVVVVTDTTDVELAVNAMHRGAADFLTRPLNGDRLRLAVVRGIGQRRLALENTRLKRDLGLSAVGQRLLETLDADKLCTSGLDVLCARTKSDAGLLLGPEGFLASRGLSDEDRPRLGALEAPHLSVVPWTPSRIDAALSGYCDGLIVGLGEQRRAILLRRTSLFSDGARDDARFLAGYFATAIRNVSRYAKARRRARRDHLTGLYNATALFEALHQAVVAAGLEQSPVSVVFMDLDRFKSVNDTHGHLNGSALLAEFGHLLTRGLRGRPACSRYGGDEFAVILPGLTTDAAVRIADRIRVRVEEHQFLKREGLNLSLTCCLGVATFPDHAQDARTLLELADRAMYVGKAKARNAVHTADAIFAAAG